MFLVIDFQGFFAIRCFQDFIAFGFQEVDNQLAHELFIICNEYFFHSYLSFFLIESVSGNRSNQSPIGRPQRIRSGSRSRRGTRTKARCIK